MASLPSSCQERSQLQDIWGFADDQYTSVWKTNLDRLCEIQNKVYTKSEQWVSIHVI
jgi:hypothetical protein